MVNLRTGAYLIPLLIACEAAVGDPPQVQGGSAGQGRGGGGSNTGGSSAGGSNTGTAASSGSSNIAGGSGGEGGSNPGTSGSRGDTVEDASAPDVGVTDASDAGPLDADAGVDAGGAAGGPSGDASPAQVECTRECVRRSDFCEGHNDCQPGQYCAGSCLPGAALHQPCASGSFCAAGLVCDSNLGTCEPFDNQADCSLISPRPCAPPEVCARTPLDAVPHCRLPAAQFDYCFFGEIPCEPGLWCDTFFEDGVCHPLTGLGRTCIAIPCVSGADCTDFESSCGEDICIETRCAEMPGEGLPCKADCYFADDCTRCASGLSCDQEICRALAELGDDCSERVCGEGLRCIDSPTGFCDAPDVP